MTLNERIEPRALTLGHLAAELAADRRTVAKALRRAGAAPVAERNGHPCYTVAQALDALARRAERVDERRLDRFRRPRPEPPGWLAAIDRLAATPFERGFAVGLMRAIYQAPRVIAGAAVVGDARLTMGQAFEVSTAATLALVAVLFEDARAAGIRPFADAGEDGPEIVALDGFVPLDWRKLAARRGEPGWRPPRRGPGWDGLDPDGPDDGEDEDEDGADDA